MVIKQALLTLAKKPPNGGKISATLDVHRSTITHGNGTAGCGIYTLRCHQENISGMYVRTLERKWKRSTNSRTGREKNTITIRYQVFPPAYTRCGRSAPACPHFRQCVFFRRPSTLGRIRFRLQRPSGQTVVTGVLSFPFRSFLYRVGFIHSAFQLLVYVHRFSANTNTLIKKKTGTHIYRIISEAASKAVRASTPDYLHLSLKYAKVGMYAT